MLYQLLVGDLACPVTVDWHKHLQDPLLQEDLARCFAGNPDDRFAKAGLMAERLREIHQRRTARATDARAQQTRRRVIGVTQRFLPFLSLFLLGVLVWALLALTRERRAELQGCISILSDPPRAQVWAGEREVGVTPYEASGLRKGDATYRLTAKNHDPQTVTIAVVPGTRTIFLAMLRPTLLSQSNSVDSCAPVFVEPRLTLIEGQVQIYRRSVGEWSQGAVGQQLAHGDQVRTGLRSRAIIQTVDQRQLTLSEATSLTIRTNKTLQLDAGKIFMHSGASNVIETPIVAAEIRG